MGGASNPTIPNTDTIFSQTANKTVENTSAKTSVLSPGSKVIPANRLRVGSIVRVKGGGMYSTPLLSIGNFTITVEANDTPIVTTTTGSLVGGMANAAFDFSAAFICRQIGVTGILAPIGGLNFAGTAGTRLFGDLINGGNDCVVDTTQDINLDVKAQWAIASLSRSLTVRGATIGIEN